MSIVVITFHPTLFQFLLFLHLPIPLKLMTSSFKLLLLYTYNESIFTSENIGPTSVYIVIGN